MRTAVFSVTKQGKMTAQKICNALKADHYSKFSTALARRLYHEYDALVFVMALGIVVRTIASEISDKKDDPIVVAVDESGRHVVSVLSGHRGANELSGRIAAITGGVPVVTTASDVQGKECVEEMAGKLHLKLDHASSVKKVNAAIVNDGNVGLLVAHELAGRDGFLHRVHLACSIPPVDSPDGCDALIVVTNREKYESRVPTAILRPRNLVVGLGSRKGIMGAKVLNAVKRSLKDANLSVLSLRALATADFKAKERGFLDAAVKLNVPLLAVSSEEIRRNEGMFNDSDVVKAKVGVGAVCEPSAVLAGRNARLVSGKRRYEGIAVAIAEESRWANSS